MDLDSAFAGLHCDLTGEQGADDEAESPGDEAGERGDDEDEDIGEGGVSGNSREPGQQLPHRSGVGEDVPEQEDQTHLRHELEQTGQSLTPAGDDVRRSGVGEDEREDGDDEGEDDGEGQGRGNPLFEESVDRPHDPF